MNNIVAYQPLITLVLGFVLLVLAIAIQVFIVRWILRVNAIIFYLEQQCELLDKNNKELQKINETLSGNRNTNKEEL